MTLREITTPSPARECMYAPCAPTPVVGSVTSYDPYDPPKLGIALDLYNDPEQRRGEPVDVRWLSRATTGDSVGVHPPRLEGPVTAISGFFNASDPDVRAMLQSYGHERGTIDRNDGDFLRKLERFIKGTGAVYTDDTTWRYYRMSMDLYTEFVSYVMSLRLLYAETQRMRTVTDEKNDDSIR